MIKKDLNSDLYAKGVDNKYIFFLQLWHELLDKRTLDIYQYRLFNTYSLLNELIEVIDKTISGLFFTYNNIECCRKECAKMLQNDTTLKKHNVSLWRTLSNHLNRKNNEKSEILSLRYQVNYAVTLMSNYIYWIFEDIKEDLENDDKDNLINHTQLLISQCIFNGWSANGLYMCDRFFTNGKTSDESWNDFKNNLCSTEHEFEIYIPLSNMNSSYTNFISSIASKLELNIETGNSIVTQNRNRFCDPLKNHFTSNKKYFKFIKNAMDIHSAIYLAVKEISDKFNILSFYNMIPAWNMHDINIIVFDTHTMYFKNYSCEELFKTYDYIDSSSFIFENTLNIVKESEYKEITNKLLGAFSYSNISRSSFFHEEKYMTLWIALESLSRTEMSDNIIANIKNTVPAALSKRYLFKIIRNFAEDMNRCNINLHFNNNITFDINNASKTNLVKDILIILKNDILYSELLDKCSCSDLLLYRLKDIHRIITDLNYSFMKFKNYNQRIEWQIQRLYRIRNEIAHSASSKKLALTIYTEHLFDYLSNFVIEIVSCIKEKKVTTTSEAFCTIQDNFAVFIEIINNKHITQEDKDILNNTVYSTGIISFV